MAKIAERCDFSLALRGSVLTKGESDKDLDLCFLREKTENHVSCSIEGLLEAIKNELHDLVDHYGAVHRGIHHPHAVIWLRDGNHIDAQFWL
jgi:hypothetical protein